MDFLKQLFGAEPLTYEQLAEKLQNNSEIKLANLASGEYVSKHRLEEAERLLKDEKKKTEGYDPEWQTKVTAAETAADDKVKIFMRDQQLEQALKGAKAKDLTAVKAHLNMETITLGEDNTLSGLDEQLASIKEESGFLFETEGTEAVLNLGGSTQGESGTQSIGLAGAIKDHYQNKN